MSGFKSLISCATTKPTTPDQGSNMDRPDNRSTDISLASLDISQLSEWNTAQVRAYVERQLGMPAKYGEALAQNDVTGIDIIEIVGENNHDQLKEIGIVAVGHRNKFIRAFRDHVQPARSTVRGQSERKTQEKGSHDIVLDRKAYGPLWDANFPGTPSAGSIPDTRFFEFFARTRIAFDFQRQIWVLCVGERHSCTFDEFVIMMKMTCYVQLGVPPQVISVDALHTNHPSNTVDLAIASGVPPPQDASRGTHSVTLTTIPTSAAAAAGSSSHRHLTSSNMYGGDPRSTGSASPIPAAVPSPGLANHTGPAPRESNVLKHIEAQASHNVMFRSLPAEVLASDDYLYSLESLALHTFNPIHFEIDGETLIATFDNDITDAILSQIRDKTIQALISMGIDTYKVQRVQLTIPPPPDPSSNNVAIYDGNYVTPGGDVGAGQVPSSSSYRGHDDVPPPPPPPQHASGGYAADPSSFYNEFMRKVDLDAEFQTIRDGKLRTMNVMNILAKLRGVGSSKDVKFNDVAIKELSNLNRTRLDMYLRNITPEQVGILMGRTGSGGANAMSNGSSSADRLVQSVDRQPPLSGLPTSSSARAAKRDDNREQFIGVVISGLPESITENDDSLLQLDAIVLNEVTVEHIEVVGTTLRITFGEMIAKTTLTAMRKSLRDFLFDNGLQKKEVKNVTIAPHTYKTWKGRITDDNSVASPPPVAYGQPHQQQTYHASSLAQQPYQQPYAYG